MASSTICTRQLFISGFSQISPSNGKFGWNILGELVKRVEGLVNKLEISTLYVNCSVKSASNRFNKFLCPPFPYFYCLIDNFFHIFKSSNFRGCNALISLPGTKITQKSQHRTPVVLISMCGSTAGLRL